MRKLGALDLDRINARDQVDRLVRDKIALDVTADIVGAAAVAIAVVVGDECAQGARIARLRRRFGLIDQRADFAFGRACRAAGREQPGGGEDARRAQDKPPTAAARR